MTGSPEKMTGHTKRPKTQLEETEKTSKLDLAGMLELSDPKFKHDLVNTLRALTDRHMLEQMEDVSGEREILKEA